MKITEIRKKLPQFEIENHPFDIGYFSRIAGASCPKKSEKRDGWKTADKELKTT